MSYLSSLKVTVITAASLFTVTQNAVAASTMVTDAAGTQELWTFQQIQGAERLTSKINQVDGKGVTQTWDGNGNMLTRTDSEGRVTSYTYNSFNQRLSMTEAYGTSEARTTAYEYVSSDIDLVTKTTSPSIYNSGSKSVTNVYDANLNIKSVTINGFDAQGVAVSRATFFEHDSFGKVIEIDGPRTDVADVTTLAYYDCNTGGQCGQLQSVTNALGHVSNYDAYDANGRLLQSTDPNGVVTNYVYHPRGWLLSTTQVSQTGDTRVTTYGYDKVGQLTKVVLPDGTEQHYVYDAAHDLREISDNLGNKVEYTYDAKGNRTHELVKDPDGTLVRNTVTTYDIRNYIESINSGGSVTQMLNDAVGNLSTQTDPNLNPSTDHQFDALDRLTRSVDALTNHSDYEYDVADQLSKVTAPNGAVTTYEYDDLGNQTKEISSDRGTTTYIHDSAGNVVSMTDARSVTLSYEYDALNRLRKANTSVPRLQTIYNYDFVNHCVNSVGRLCRVLDSSGAKFYDYDAWGNVVRVRRNERDFNGNFLDTFITEYAYDAGNRLTSIRYPSGRTVGSKRDSIGRLTLLATVDLDGNVRDIINSRHYRADGLWTNQSFANGLIQTKQYDTQGRLISHVAGSYSRDYIYDANGNIVSADAADNSQERDYQYDVLDRLTSESDSVRSLIRDYQYDANGNREQLSQSSVVTPLTYEANTNRLASINGASVVLDASGRTLSDASGRSFTYNDLGRLEQVHLNGQLVGQYVYNYQQQRAQKEVAGDLTVYHYDLAGNLIAESDRQGNTLIEYVYADGERVAAIVPGDATPEGISNLALGKVATQVDTINGAVASRAIDGITDGFYANGSLSITSSRAQPWWQVDLTQDSAIDSIIIHNREDAGTDRLADFNVFISDTPFGQQTESQLIANANVTRFYHSGTLASSSLTIDTSGTTGRYVRLQLSGTNYLNFAEMQIMGSATGNTPNLINVAKDRYAEQVSVYAGGSANRGVDGSADPEFAGASVLLTAVESQPWWQVDLAKARDIDTVRVYQRMESNAPYSQSLADFYVMLSPTPFGSRTLAQLLADPTVEHQYHAGNFMGASLDFDMQSASGRYVRIQLSGTGRLELAEVEVLQQSSLVEQTAAESGVHYYVNDHLMTPKQAVNQSNEVTWSAEYTAFGNTDISVERFVNNHRYPGQYYDSETGLYYNWNRYYDPGTGRYVTSDPIGLRAGFNTYGYVYGNPLMFTDSNGLAPDQACVAACMAAGGAAGGLGGRVVGGAVGGAVGGLGGGVLGSAVPVAGTAAGAAAGATTGAAVGSVTGAAGGTILGSRLGGALGTLLCSDDGEAESCEEEWRRARQTCRDLIYEELEQRAGRRKKRSVRGVTGGFNDVEQCASGLVSQRCGGNAVR